MYVFIHYLSIYSTYPSFYFPVSLGHGLTHNVEVDGQHLGRMCGDLTLVGARVPPLCVFDLQLPVVRVLEVQRVPAGEGETGRGGVSTEGERKVCFDRREKEGD